MENRPEQEEVVQKSGVLFTYSTKSTMGASTDPFFDLSSSLFSFSNRLRLQTSKSIPCLLHIIFSPSPSRSLVFHPTILSFSIKRCVEEDWNDVSSDRLYRKQAIVQRVEYRFPR